MKSHRKSAADRILGALMASPEGISTTQGIELWGPRFQARVHELVQEGWRIRTEQDPVTEVAVYRLLSPVRGPALTKYFGVTVTWGSEGGLETRIHQDPDDRIPTGVLLDLRAAVGDLVRRSLSPYLDDRAPAASLDPREAPLYRLELP